MQKKYELATRLTYFWNKIEKKIFLNFIFVFKPLLFWHNAMPFQNLLQKKSYYNLWWGSVASHRFPGSHYQGPGCQDPMSQGRKSQGPRSQFKSPRIPSLRVTGSRVPESRVSGSRVSGSQVPGSRVSGPDFSLCPVI